MDAVSETYGATGQQPQPTQSKDDALRGLALDEFLKLMVTELQNQDPLDPMENSEILTQISQMREIEASGKMSDVLDSLSSSIDGISLGQRVAGASSMIGKHIQAEITVPVMASNGKAEVDDHGEIKTKTQAIQGVVDRVSFGSDEPTVHVDGHDIKMSAILKIASSADALGDLGQDAEAEETAATDQS